MDSSGLSWHRVRALAPRAPLSRRGALVGVLMGIAFVTLVGLAAWIVDGDEGYARLRPGAQDERLLPPSWTHPLGTDGLGHDIISSLLRGARLSLFVAFGGGALLGALGGLLGGIAGYAGGAIDATIMRLADLLLALPGLALLLIVGTYVGTETPTLILLLAALGWPSLARLVRAEVRKVREAGYVVAARGIGLRPVRILWRHVLPSVSSLLLVQAVLAASRLMLLEAALSYLGFGDPNAVSWGRMLAQAQTGHALLSGAWWWIVPPGLAIAAMALALMSIAYGFEAILNPQARSGAMGAR